MIEADWCNYCLSPRAMLDHLQAAMGPELCRRRLRLFACACCRRIWHHLDERLRRIIEAAEQPAEEGFGDGYLTEASSQVGALSSWGVLSLAAALAVALDHDNPQPFQATLACQDEAAAVACPSQVARLSELESQCDLLRDIWGNPFRPISCQPNWLTWNDGTLPRLARAIYDDYAFDRLPILADALEDAGCTNAVILGHCRGGETHVRGCWVVGMLLGQT